MSALLPGQFERAQVGASRHHHKALPRPNNVHPRSNSSIPPSLSFMKDFCCVHAIARDELTVPHEDSAVEALPENVVNG